MRDAFGVENPAISKRDGSKGRDAAYGAAGATGGAAAGAVGMTAKEGVRGINEARGAVKAAKDVYNADNFVFKPGEKPVRIWDATSRADKVKGITQVAANPAYRKLLKPKTAAVAGGAALLAGGGAAAAHHKLSKSLPSVLRNAERLGVTYGNDAVRNASPRAKEIIAGKIAANRAGKTAAAAHAAAGKTPEFGARMSQAGLRPGSQPYNEAASRAGQAAAKPHIERGQAAAAEAKAPVERSNRAIETIHNDANDLAVNGRMAQAKLDRASAARRRRNYQIAGGVAGASALGGGAVLGYDYVKGRKNKDAKTWL